MPFFPFPEWKPDLADYLAPHTKTVENVYPQADGYGVVLGPNSSAISTAAARVRGAFLARKSDGTNQIFLGTATKLYRQTAATLDDVSKAAGTYTTLANTDYNWGFAQFGDLVIAVQGGTVPQVFNMDGGTAFADLGGSPPTARFVSVVAGFVVLSGLTANPFRVHWSGQGNATEWTQGTDQSDFQDFSDGGPVGPVAGGADYATVFQKSTIRRMTYVPGSPTIFQIDKIITDRGLLRNYSMVPVGETIFYISQHGIERLSGSQSVNIGKERVNRTYFDEAGTAGSLPELTIGAADPNATRILWSYDVSVSDFGKLLVYDYKLDKFSSITLTADGEWIGTLANVNIAGTPALYLIDGSHALRAMDGTRLAATLVTSDFGSPDGKRIFIRGIRPILDSTESGVTVQVSSRAEMRDTESYSSTVAINDEGYAPFRVSTRYARCKVVIPVSGSWTFAGGVEPDYITEGMR